MNELSLHSIEKPRIRRVVWIGSTVVVGLLAAAIVVGISTSDRFVVMVPITSVTVTAPPAPQPSPPPLPPVVTTPPAPSPRAIVPTLNAACVVPPLEPPTATLDRACEWDDGFPAVSQDGSLIATKYLPPSGPRSTHGFSIHFIDASSRLVRDALVLSEAELDAVDSEDARSRLVTLVAQRVVEIQRTLDAQRFRTMAALGDYRLDTDERVEPTDKPYVDFSHSAMRIVDPKTSSVLWQYRATRAAFMSKGPTRVSVDDMCGGANLHSQSVWWDREAKRVLVTQHYRTGGCMCPGVTAELVQRMP